MERVRKTFFNPLATSKANVREILEELPVGSAHPFSPERILLCKTENGIDEIDISSYPEDYFFNAVDLGEMGEVLQRRMAGFEVHLKVFEDFQIQQAPASTFRIPIDGNKITILAVSERTPTYYDFCFADESCNTCCYCELYTFKGVSHSGDVVRNKDFLAYVKMNSQLLTEKELCVFISGYQSTHITKFLGTHPALLVANHEDKVLYVIPVPLDAATIGDSTICCPLVVKRDGNSLICSVLPTATTDRNMMCCGSKLVSPCFPEAIKRADFTISAPIPTNKPDVVMKDSLLEESTVLNAELLRKIAAKETAVITTSSTVFPSFMDLEKSQIIEFGTGIKFKLPGEDQRNEPTPSSVVLPCIFGSQLEGPVLLATGTAPSNVPFVDAAALRAYYQQLKSVVVIVNDRMTDNARNLATSYRINALFIVQLNLQDQPKDTDEVLSLLNSTNVNAVTALAGPQSLVLVQVADKYYFYRGLANRAHLNTSGLAFGSDVTSVVESVGMESMIDPRVKRVVSLDGTNTIILPTSGQLVQPQNLQNLFEELSIEQIQDLEEDIASTVPQLQALMNQKELKELSQALVSALSSKVTNVTAPLRDTYLKFLSQEYQMADPELVKKKNNMLGHLRKVTKELQKSLESAISSLANMMSSRTTSKRTHDLKRLVRQAQIQGNVEAAKALTFEGLAGYLENYAADMGVMVMNIEEGPYSQLLGNLKNAAIDASPCCALDSRVLNLEGLDAGIILEQSQEQHQGPLSSQGGPTQPILALPYLSKSRGSGSMLAWVCWDEFVNLESPYTVRWVDKCNDPHIAALRIIMRDTLSRAVVSREHNFEPASLEISYLMSALLIAAMSKLAAMKTTAPVVLEKAEDTITRLMRGLFGNLLTVAGSGVKPLSMVWQLFGANSLFDIPRETVDWIWYETVTNIYPYTGWPLTQFHDNLERFLDKVVIRVVNNSEDAGSIKASRVEDMIKFCKLRNIQLEHSRTIITVFMRMLTTPDIDIAAVASRLKKQLPRELDKQSSSYTRMIQYLEHLAKGGSRRAQDDLVAASVYTKRSAAFSALKAEVATACKSNDWEGVKKSCQALLVSHDELAKLWSIKPTALKFQNMKTYKSLLDAHLEDDVDEETKAKNHELTRQVLNDAERNRIPWQVGKEGQFGGPIEPLHESFVHEMLTGETPESLLTTSMAIDSKPAPEAALQLTQEQEFEQFKSVVEASFILTMQKTLSAEDVCEIMKVPATTMRVFVKALNPEFVWENLAGNFKEVVLALLKDRSGRASSRPVRRLLELGEEKKMVLVEG